MLTWANATLPIAFQHTAAMQPDITDAPSVDVNWQESDLSMWRHRSGRIQYSIEGVLHGTKPALAREHALAALEANASPATSHVQ